jgi:hypothetical protein
MRHGFSTTSLVIGATVALGYWSTASAGSSFKIVTAPSGTGQVQSNADSSFKIVAGPQLSQAAANGPSLNEPDPDERQVNSKVTLPRRAVQLVRLPSSTQREVSFDEPYAVVNTSNRGVVDVDQLTDHAVLLRALKQGNADLFFYDIKGKLVNALEVSVDDFNYNIDKPVSDPGVRSYGYFTLHNKALLNSQTNFRCRYNDCQYVGETTVTEPAPLPRGYSNQNINSNQSVNYSGAIGGGGTQAVPPTTTPP